MSLYNKQNISRKESITVNFFYQNAKEKFNLQIASSEVGMDRLIKDQNLHRPGLALAGFVELYSFSRIQVFGNTEMKYLNQLSSEERKLTLERLFKFDIPTIIVTDGNKPFGEMLELATKFNIPLFCTTYPTTKLVYLVTDFLDDQFAPSLTYHGSYVDVYGVGMLFIGKSGVGKSEVALDLVERGHRLVADDVVVLTKKGEGILMGQGTELIQHFMEIRGIGIVDIRSMFGVRAIRFQKRLEVLIELEIWDNTREYTRTGLDEGKIEICDVSVPHVRLPILPGKNITVISEIIALNYLLKHYGYDSAKVLTKRLENKIKEKSQGVKGVVDYFEHDFE